MMKKVAPKRLLGFVISMIMLSSVLFLQNNNSFDTPEYIKLTNRELLELTQSGDYSIAANNHHYSAAQSSNGIKSVTLKKKGFPFKKVKTKIVPEQHIYVGGTPIGFAMYTNGVIIVGMSGVTTEDGKVNPSEKSDIKSGDILLEIEGNKITSISDINTAINKDENAGKTLKIKLKRKNKFIDSTITPALDAATNTYKLGLWIRDSAAGIGTITYIKKENRHFGALGHPICDADTSTEIPVGSGKIYKCSLLSVTKGQRGKPGELRGIFLKTNEPIGEISKNNKFGVFGKIDEIFANDLYPDTIPVANRSSVKPGKAILVTTIDQKPEKFNIEIIKTNYQKSKDSKSLVVRVTDKMLLEKTGGIVQGMSGSPIIQNGKIVGAITHVFINDPTKGFGVYLDWMYDEY